MCRSALGRALVVAAAVLAPVPASAEEVMPPFSLADVDFAADCRPNAAFERLLTVLLGSAGRPAVGEGGVSDEPLYNAVSGATLHVLMLSNDAPWNGLRLAGVRLSQGVESGPFNLSLVFADSAERVREVWNARGWNLPPVGETRVLQDDGIVPAVGVNSDGQHAAVTCFRD